MTAIIVNLQEEGLHFWKEAEKLPQVNYLKYPHRHVFHIKCIKRVDHLDRDIEIIDLKHQIKDYLEGKYYDSSYELLNFHGMSCEMIASELLDKFQLYSCEVLEDGENGCLIDVN